MNYEYKKREGYVRYCKNTFEKFQKYSSKLHRWSEDLETLFAFPLSPHHFESIFVFFCFLFFKIFEELNKIVGRLST